MKAIKYELKIIHKKEIVLAADSRKMMKKVSKQCCKQRKIWT